MKHNRVIKNLKDGIIITSLLALYGGFVFGLSEFIRNEHYKRTMKTYPQLGALIGDDELKIFREYKDRTGLLGKSGCEYIFMEPRGNRSGLEDKTFRACEDGTVIQVELFEGSVNGINGFVDGEGNMVHELVEPRIYCVFGCP